MKKVAIVGVEGSGKTVMLAGLGELYAHPDARGYFLVPKNFDTVRYVNDQIALMRTGRWPGASPDDLLQGLDWTLRKTSHAGQSVDVCTISCLDFAGEVYRKAFCSTGPHRESEEEIALKDYIDNCDDLIVLINLRDVITHGPGGRRVQQAMWITNEILAYALGRSRERKPVRATLVLSQADSYRETIRACGGAEKVLEKYLPHVWHSYGHLGVIAASAVDRVRLDDTGANVPCQDFQPTRLQPIMDWIIQDVKPRSVFRSRAFWATVFGVSLAGAVAVVSLKGPRAGDRRTIALADGVTLELVWCPKGSFVMGSPASEKGHENAKEAAHRVRLSQGFWMGRTEVTQAQWKSVMGYNPSHVRDPNRPVENVSWEDCQEFCRRVGAGLRLPTEAEWEYACRAGSKGAFAGTGEIDDMGWYDGNSKRETHPVAQKRPNAWGLYDMHGNVWEWCQDRYGPLAAREMSDPTGPAVGEQRVIRGGSYGQYEQYCRSAWRGYTTPSDYQRFGGFRVCCPAKSLEK